MKHDNDAMLRAWWLSSSIGCVCTYSKEGNDRRMEMYTTSTSMQNIESNLTSPLLGLISSSACMEGGPVNTTSWLYRTTIGNQKICQCYCELNESNKQFQSEKKSKSAKVIIIP